MLDVARIESHTLKLNKEKFNIMYARDNPGCVDMTNASSTYLSIVIGAVVGALITWWVYKIQKNTTVKQEETLSRVNAIEESHDKVLKSIEIAMIEAHKA